MYCKLFKSTVMIKKESTDAQLVSAYMNGNEQAISELITRHKQKIYSFIYSKVFNRDISEDIFQDTFIKVIVRNKTNPYIFDLFLDRLQAASPCDIKVVEDHMNLDVIDESELVDEAQDTLTILKQYVQNLEISTDKAKIEKVLQELHNEAINL